MAGVEPNPGPGANGSESGDSVSDPKLSLLPATSLEQIMVAINQLGQAVNRIELAQSHLSAQQARSAATLQQRLGEVEHKLHKRLESLEHHQDLLSQDMKATSVKLELLEEENVSLKEMLIGLESRLDREENHSRRNNLLFHGIASTPGETWADCESKVKNIIRSDMKVTDEIAIERAHRVGRAIIVRLASSKDKDTLLKAAKNLATTNNSISVREDLSRTVRTKRSKLVPMMKALKGDGKKAKLRFDKLVTDDGVYTFNLQTEEIVRLSDSAGAASRSAQLAAMDFTSSQRQGDEEPSSWN
jgi:hypothetical protein